MTTRDEQIQYINSAVYNNNGLIRLTDDIPLPLSVQDDQEVVIVEVFGGGVIVTEYLLGYEADTYCMDFDDLSDDIIAEIALGVENYEADMEKDMKRIK